MVKATPIKSAISALACLAEQQQRAQAILMGALALTHSEDETVRTLIDSALDDLSDIRYRMQIESALEQIQEELQ